MGYRMDVRLHASDEAKRLGVMKYRTYVRM